MTDRDWLTAAEAAKLLKMGDRQVHRYGVAGKIQTRKSGRRILYQRDSILALADELQVDIRPQAISRQDATDQLISYIRDRRERDSELLDIQGRIEQNQERIERNQDHIAQRLDELEVRLTPRPQTGPNWMLIAAVIIIVLLVIILVAVVVLR